ncbi:MAG TPA: glycoside hydrolase family 25 protein [Candidatus Dormibacteraeota bacterium]|nr:glycoside hydrolase family 25 protein [Candidatus Dormibacteraeota bacterium]
MIRTVRSTLPRLAALPELPAGVVRGCDISSYQGKAIDWAAAAGAGIKQAYVQISQGTGVVNPDAQSQIEGARAAGISVGAYHLCYPALNTPQSEYDYFMSHLGSLPVNLPSMLDDETKLDKAWVRTMLGLMGAPTLHYSDESYLKALGNLGYRQWTARPGATGLYPGDYATQFASAPLAGFPGDVDLDYFDPAPPKEVDVATFIIFEATIVAGPQAGTVGQFSSNKMRFRHLTQAEYADAAGVFAAGGDVVDVWPGGPVADVAIFGNPDDAVTAAMFPALPSPVAPAAPAGSLSLSGTMKDNGDGTFAFTGTGSPES